MRCVWPRGGMSDCCKVVVALARLWTKPGLALDYARTIAEPCKPRFFHSYASAHPMSSPKPSSRLANWRDYLHKNDIKASLTARVRALKPGDGAGSDTLHNLSQWAGQKIRGDAPTVNQVDLFPGWATRRPRLSDQRKTVAFLSSASGSLVHRRIRSPCPYLRGGHFSAHP